jgi:acetolactate synthase-1/3 small subunit
LKTVTARSLAFANLFSGRGYNISSLTVAETEDATVSRMTIVVTGDEEILEQIVKQLNKLIDVIKVIDFIGEPIIERELLLARIDTSKSNRHEIIELCDIFKARIVSVSQKSLTVEMSGSSATSTIFFLWSSPSASRRSCGRGRLRSRKGEKKLTGRQTGESKAFIARELQVRIQNPEGRQFLSDTIEAPWSCFPSPRLMNFLNSFSSQIGYTVIVFNQPINIKESVLWQ